MDRTPIDLAAIYDITMEFCSAKASRNWHARLRRRGFKLSTCKEAYYHPDHWESGGMGFKDGPGDTWLMDDAFKAKTQQAREWLKKEEAE